ncbi:glycosyltransferase [Cytobacillus oceanisediminis]|uniref:CgeB family protein n=1 Tax=Cytobacillus oceanisediminis TaxID=665099 RepID=UPI0023DAEDD3|nr:glycosyltransferase [Cytobacillus oceanisediminis]MDF2035791.1 glycosyltransferase [Cytobacillus oceanisediminis]
MIRDRILMCYGRTPYTPGKFLEDGLKGIGVLVDVYEKEIDFFHVDLSKYMAVLFVESPSRPPVKVKNIDMVHIPKLFWITHGKNRLHKNKKLCKMYKPDLLLMVHLTQLSEHFSLPTQFFPFAAPNNVFNCSLPLHKRYYDLSFVGSQKPIYDSRTNTLKFIESHLQKDKTISLFSNVYLENMAALYNDSKMVFNQSTEELMHINMRLFEGMGCGALVLTDVVPDQDRIFIDSKHYVTYRNKDELLEKIEYYLTHLDEAQAIATRGYKHILKKHTYEKRARDLLLLIKKIRTTMTE